VTNGNRIVRGFILIDAVRFAHRILRVLLRLLSLVVSSQIFFPFSPIERFHLQVSF